MPQKHSRPAGNGAAAEQVDETNAQRTDLGSQVKAAALAWHDTGFCAIPAKSDGSKAPSLTTWTQYQSEQYPRRKLEATTGQGFGLICGAVSGGLEMFELEGLAVAEGCLDRVVQLVNASGLGDLWRRLTSAEDSYVERTPSGGLHILCRISGLVPGNTKLARRPARDDELTDQERAVRSKQPGKVFARVLAETRGEGGFTVTAPSGGSTHPSGRSWEIVCGRPGVVPTITPEERELLTPVLRTLDQMPAAAPREQFNPTGHSPGDRAMPGNDFEARTDWADELLLGGAGWEVVTSRSDGYRTWRRPGKDAAGISATTGQASDRDRLYVFSTSTEFDDLVPITKFHAYAVLHHGGDHKAAGQELRRLGYGQRSGLEQWMTEAGARTVTGAEHLLKNEQTGQGRPMGEARQGEPWDDPLPIGWRLSSKPFPVGVFPPLVERYVQAVAESTQTPVDMVGTVTLGVQAACIGGRVDVQCPTWIEPTNLFVVPVMPPASRKSAVVAACRIPLTEAERQLRDESAGLVYDSQTRAEVLQKMAETSKAKAAKEGDPILLMEAQEAVRRAEEAKAQVMTWPRLTASDATPEALVTLLAEQGGRLAAVSAEAGVFAALTGRYSKTPNLDPVLQSHAGDTVMIDRRSRAPEYVERPALTMIASIQPFALREMVSRDDFAGRGLLARVLWSLPTDNAGYRRVRDVPAVPEAVAQAFKDHLTELAVRMAKTKHVVVLKLDPAATEALYDYAEQVEKALRPAGDLGQNRLTREWGGKLVGAVARIAGCLHAVAGPLDTSIPAGTMRAAIELGDYYRAHAISALGGSEDERADAGRAVIEVVVRREMSSFTMRELMRRVPRALQKSEPLKDALDYLTLLGWVRPAPKGWEVHPSAAELLKGADTADSADTPGVPAGQDYYAGIPEPVSTSADTADNLTDPFESVSTVSTPADTSYPPSYPVVTSGNVRGVSAVSSVSSIPLTAQSEDSTEPPETPAESGKNCPECDQVPPAGAWGPCSRCRKPTHRYGTDAHGALCAGCRSTAANGQQMRHCPECNGGVPALAWVPCDRCGEPTHARGRGAHGPTCQTCLTERNSA